MRLPWFILLAGLVIAGAILSFIGKILFYIAGITFVVLLIYWERRRRSRINRP